MEAGFNTVLVPVCACCRLCIGPVSPTMLIYFADMAAWCAIGLLVLQLEVYSAAKRQSLQQQQLLAEATVAVAFQQRRPLLMLKAGRGFTQLEKAAAQVSRNEDSSQTVSLSLHTRLPWYCMMHCLKAHTRCLCNASRHLIGNVVRHEHTLCCFLTVTA